MLKKITITTMCIVGLTVLTLFFKFNRQAKTGYVQIQKVFNEFSYKKEMEARLKKVNELRKHEMDSLELRLKILFKEFELNTKDAGKLAVFQTHKEEFLKRKDLYEKDYATAVAQYDELIIKQLNTYIKEYGEQKNYKYIFGTDGKGGLMYADSTQDLTAQVIEYVNDKYKGKAN